jgi:hypothetical protein
MTGKSHDPLFDLWAGLGRALAPFGVAVTPTALRLWREQYERGSGPLRAAERGNAEAIDDVIRMLRELRSPDPGAGAPGAD